MSYVSMLVHNQLMATISSHVLRTFLYPTMAF